MYMYVCMYICMYVCMHIYTDVCIYVYVYFVYICYVTGSDASSKPRVAKS